MDSDHDEYADWIRVFESIVQLLDDYEQYRHNTSNVSARENIAIRMESVFVLLQQVIACTSPGNLECFSFIEAILRNILSLPSRGLRSSGLVRFSKLRQTSNLHVVQRQKIPTLTTLSRMKATLSPKPKSLEQVSVNLKKLQ